MKNRPFFERLRYALRGIHWALKSEHSFKTQSVFAIGALGLLAAFRAPAIWWALFIITIGAVLAAELVNTALEYIADRVHPEIHPTIGAAKDCAAGAVLVLAIGSLGVLGAFLWSMVG